MKCERIKWKGKGLHGRGKNLMKGKRIACKVKEFNEREKD